MDNQNLFDLIESYLDDSLPEAKKQEVERRMAEDEGFRQEVELRRQLQEHFSDAGRARLRAALKDIV
jgi:anti-sigma factor RsiW